jgi:ribonuclease HI
MTPATLKSAPAKQVVMFTDGACLGNPGPGGYGIVLLYGNHRRELSSGFSRTTNNRMELMAAIKGLEALKQPCRVALSADSQYLINGISKGWARAWRERGWRRRGKVVPNWELWRDLLDLCDRHHVRWTWVEGHTGDVENERCDELAKAAALVDDLPPDVGYETPPVP